MQPDTKGREARTLHRIGGTSPATIRLAAVRIPSRWARSTASFTAIAAPKSSAVTIRRLRG
jgi:hypothetical protein